MSAFLSPQNKPRASYIAAAAYCVLSLIPYSFIETIGDVAFVFFLFQRYQIYLEFTEPRTKQKRYLLGMAFGFVGFATLGAFVGFAFTLNGSNTFELTTIMGPFEVFYVLIAIYYLRRMDQKSTKADQSPQQSSLAGKSPTIP